MKKKITIYIEEEFDRGLTILLHKLHIKHNKKTSKSAMIEMFIATLLQEQDTFFINEDESEK